MNFGPTLTVQSNQTDQFHNYYKCNQLRIFLNERNGKTHYSNVQFQSLLVQVFTGIDFYQQPNYPIACFPLINSSENTCFPSEVMTATEATVGEFIWVPFFTNIRRKHPSFDDCV